MGPMYCMHSTDCTRDILAVRMVQKAGLNDCPVGNEVRLDITIGEEVAN